MSGILQEKSSVFVFKTFGLKKSEIEGKFLNFLNDDERNMLEVDEYCLDAKVTVKCFDEKQKSDLVCKLFNEFAYNIYADEDETLAERTFKHLKNSNLKVGIAESLTGGLVVSDLIKYPGASSVVMEGVVSYSNASKVLRLGVDSEIIKKFSAVSRQTAFEMVKGLLAKSYNDIGVSTTGYADKSDAYTPAGLFYVGIGDREKISVHKFKVDGNRDEVRRIAANAALFYLLKKAKGNFYANEYFK